MFTGIVQGQGQVHSVGRKPGIIELWLELSPALLQDVTRGGSISVDGVCLTVTEFDTSRVRFDVMQETLNCSTLGQLSAGNKVNIERAARGDQEIGGHQLSGHVDCMAEVAAIETPQNNKVLTFRLDPKWMRYIFAKGYIALNGTSLTIAAVDKSTSSFTVWLIPETLSVTTFGSKKIGDKINVEIERSTQVIVDTVRDFLKENLKELAASI